jgi:hypothetical protein
VNCTISILFTELAFLLLYLVAPSFLKSSFGPIQVYVALLSFLEISFFVKLVNGGEAGQMR